LTGRRSRAASSFLAAGGASARKLAAAEPPSASRGATYQILATQRASPAAIQAAGRRAAPAATEEVAAAAGLGAGQAGISYATVARLRPAAGGAGNEHAHGTAHGVRASGHTRVTNNYMMSTFAFDMRTVTTIGQVLPARVHPPPGPERSQVEGVAGHAWQPTGHAQMAHADARAPRATRALSADDAAPAPERSNSGPASAAGSPAPSPQ
jgi:hypothetical protein